MRHIITLTCIITMVATLPVLAEAEKEVEFKLEHILAGTTWEWGGPREQIEFKSDGYIGHPGWERRGLVTSWKVIDEHTVLLMITEGRRTDRYSILTFNKNLTEYTGYDFHKTQRHKPSKKLTQGSLGAKQNASASQKPLTKNESTPPTDFAWQNANEYIAPNFESFFPDNLEGGKALDALFESKTARVLADQEILNTVREGLRRTTKHRTLILSWIGNKYIWGENPQHPYAVEIMYHAAHPSDKFGTRHYAIYFGLSVLNKRTPNINHVLIENYLADEDRGRIVWGLKNDREAKSQIASLLLEKLARYKELPQNEVVLAVEFYENITGKTPPQPERFADIGAYIIMFRPRGSFKPTTKEELLDRVKEIASLEESDECKGGIERGELYGFVIVNANRRDSIIKSLKSSNDLEIVRAELMTKKLARRLKQKETR